VKLNLEKPDMEFSSAHFLVGEGFCERLHGHNYRVKICVEGEPRKDKMVINFLSLKAIAKKLCEEYDHKFLLPLKNPLLKITEENDSIKIETVEKKTYVFPKSDVVKLDIKDSTCEELAKDYCQKLIKKLEETGELKWGNIKLISVTVEEAEGQGATETRKL